LKPSGFCSVDSRLPFYNLDLFRGEDIQFIDQVINFTIGGDDLALEHVFLLRQGGGLSFKTNLFLL
jgi:hypothetical protein